MGKCVHRYLGAERNSCFRTGSLHRGLSYPARDPTLPNAQKNGSDHHQDLYGQVGRKNEPDTDNADAMFDEEGYIVLSVKKAESLIDRISNVVDVADKLGWHFVELRF